MQSQPSVHIFPESGYRNSTFAFRFTNLSGKKNINIYKDNKLFSSNTLSDDASLIYQRAEQAGRYKVIVTDHTGVTAENEFVVQDSVQIGSSVVKSTFLFPQFNKVFIVKKDRLLIYDIDQHTELMLNGISPTSITAIDSKYLLFETVISGNQKVSNLGIFEISTLSIVATYESICKIDYNKETQVIWFSRIHDETLEAIDLKNFATPESMLFSSNGRVIRNEECGDFLILENERLHIVELEKYAICESLDKDESAAISLKECIIAHSSADKLTFKTFFSSITPIITPPETYSIDLEFDWQGSDFKKTSEHRQTKEVLIAEARQLAVNKLRSDEIKPGERIEFIFQPAANKSFEHVTFSFYRIGRNVYRSTMLQKYTYSGLVKVSKSLYHQDAENLLMNFDMESVFEQHVRINHYKGIFFTFYEDLPLTYISVIRPANKQRGLLVLHSGTERLCVISDGQKTFEIQDITKFGEPELRRLDRLGYYIVKTISGGYTELYKIEENNCRLLVDVKSKLHHSAYLDDYNLLWLRNTASHPKIYYEVYDIAAEAFVELAKKIQGSDPAEPGGEYIVDTSGKFENGYFLTKDQVLVCLKPFEIKGAVAGRIIGHSDDMNLVLTYTDGNGYYLFQYHQAQERYLPLKISDPDLSYQEAKLVPNGRHALLKTAGKDEVQIFDIGQQKVISFFTGKFLGFTNEGSIIIETTMHRAVKVFDPDTFEDITPAQYQFYRHLSPDGKLFSQRSQKYGYYHFPERRQLSKEEFERIQALFKQQPKEDYNTYEYRYRKLLADASRTYNSYFKGSSYKFKSHHEIAAEVTFIEIGITGTDITAYLPAIKLIYYNYVAFSFDNKYVGYVGKPAGTGLFQLFKIDYNEAANTLKILDHVTHNDPTLATWVCAFSKGGHFGTYDSAPNTFVVKVDEDLFANKFEAGNIRKHTKTLNGKSFECFSPDGAYLALSEKGYEPISLGGRGHMNSKDLYIAENETGKITRHFREHGDHVIFAAFSEDGKRLLSSSKDGVVIIRDIDLNVN